MADFKKLVADQVPLGNGSSPLTTKGDIFVYSNEDTRLPVGANGTVLSADSSEPSGLKFIPVSGVSVPKEEEITGTRLTNSTVSGSQPLDWDLYKLFEFTLTGATTLTDSNLPTGVNTKVIELVITGQQTLSLPSYWEAMPSNDDYDGTVRNHLVVSCINGTASNEDIIYSLQNLST